MECLPWPCSELGCCSHIDSERKALGVQPHSPEKSQTSRFPTAGCLRWDKGPAWQGGATAYTACKNRKNQILGSVGCLAVPGSTREAGAREKFFQKVWLHSEPVPSSSHVGQSWCGSAERRGAAIAAHLRRCECLGGGGRSPAKPLVPAALSGHSRVTGRPLTGGLSPGTAAPAKDDKIVLFSMKNFFPYALVSAGTVIMEK